MDRDTLLDLIPAYALGALDPEEHAEVEALLATDAEAQSLLTEYQAMAEELVLTTPARRAPAHLGADLRARLAANRAEPDIQLVPPTERPRLHRKQRTWIPYALGLAASIALVFAALLILNRPGDVPPDNPAERYAWIVAQAGARRVTITSELAPTLSGELVVTADGQYGVIQVENMPQLPPERAYELWYINEAGPHSAGLLDIDNPEAAHYISLPEPAEQYNAYAVSVEPETGSPDPNAPSGDIAFAVEV
jgi:anti-sigma-K factor RskA